jgi:hypothetical protein
MVEGRRKVGRKVEDCRNVEEGKGRRKKGRTRRSDW